MITLNAYAKLNLSLDVTGKRADGYHELDGIMQTVSIPSKIPLMPPRRLFFRTPASGAVRIFAYKSAYRACRAWAEPARTPPLCSQV